MEQFIQPQQKSYKANHPHDFTRLNNKSQDKIE